MLLNQAVKRRTLFFTKIKLWKSWNSTRLLSINSQITTQLKSSYMEIKNKPNSTPLQVDYFWLRDHCRCDACFNNATHQRILPLLSIPMDIRPLSCNADFKYLLIKWSDGHESKYELQWLTDTCEPENQLNGLQSLYDIRRLWENGVPPVVPQVRYQDINNGISGTASIIEALLKYGFVTVNQVPPTLQGTEAVVKAIGPVQTTFFGSMWQFGPDLSLEKHADTAYTREPLDPHNDGTYFTEASGLQVFHCLGRSENAKGGQTMLVDGMAAVNLLKQEHPDSYETLSTVPTEAEYKEKQRHYVNLMPVIVTDPLTKHVLQIRFNLYDRAPFRTLFNPTCVRRYYTALRNLSNIILSGQFSLKLLLEPGTVLIIDNWRVLHGRTGFTGSRHMCGCYVARSDWISTARVLGFLY